MLNELNNLKLDIKHNETLNTISYKNILVCLLIFGVVTSAVFTIFSFFLYGPFTLLNIIASPVFVIYVSLELKSQLVPLFFEHMCSEKAEKNNNSNNNEDETVKTESNNQ
ncbi:MAG: hypothetical protein CML20_14730 [Rheinheimera sp.]|nr:hypothetical protein [Rheinheimera sp.]|tara:strand:- start:14629 stop:14958 length:330 start_codon:yes stop_codon:yes gene_type:complete